MQRKVCTVNYPSSTITNVSTTALPFCPKEVKKMLGQRVELSALKSQTLPRFDGHDEEGEAHETHFEILSIANSLSLPDLSLGELNESPHSGLNHERGSSPPSPLAPIAPAKLSEDDVDGLFYKAVMIPNKLPLSFRRSTSLNSLEAEGYSRSEGAGDSNPPGTLQQGTVAKVVGQLEQTLKKDHHRQLPTSDFVRSTQRASYNGSGSGFLHKSVSSPSVPQCFGTIPSIGGEQQRGKNSGHLIDTSRHHHSTASQQHSTKRSFFRRKQKVKGASGQTNSQQYKRDSRMNGAPSAFPSGDDNYHDSLGYFALSDPSLGLQEPEMECWTLFMGPEVVSRLTDKEIKRQEHMYELILTEKHHCLTLALMHYLFLGEMKRAGFRRQARLMFPLLNELLQVHFSFLRQMRQRQLKFRDMGEPLDSLASLLVQQFTSEPFNHMVRCYGLLYTSNVKSLEIFKTLKLKEQKFASLVTKWSKEPLLNRKNVPECLLLVAQRITKYPLLIEPLLKTCTSPDEKDELIKAVTAARELNSKVNERVDERQRLSEICQRLDSKSITTDGSRRVRREDLLMVPSRRLLFQGQAIVNCNRVIGGTVSSTGGSAGPLSTRNGPCNVLILTDSLVLTQEVSGRLYFASPPGIVMLNNLIIRENAGHNSSLFIVYGTTKPEMIELQVINPRKRDIWLEAVRDAVAKFEENADVGSDLDDDSASDAMEFSDLRTTRALEELQEQDRQIMALLKSRTKIIESLRTEKPHHWTSSSLEGKYDVLNAISVAANEVQRMLTHMDANNANGVNRSASCVSQHVSSGSAPGLPRRADTFGGFDSQQRSSLDLSHNLNNKVLFQMVIQLADLCGEVFQQMIPNLTPNIYSHNQHQVQRRMEDLREAQQRLESEKAAWQLGFNVQKEELDKQRMELNAFKESLHKEQEDISHQREQLYRKLEKLEIQGMRPLLDSVSPSGAGDKITVTNVSTRRLPSQSSPVLSSHSSNNSTAGGTGKPPKQQLPLHLAMNAGTNSNNNNNITSVNFEPPKPIPRSSSSVMSSSKPGGAGNVNSFGDALSRLSSGSQVVKQNSMSQVLPRATPNTNNNSSRSIIQQLLPLRLSEGRSSSGTNKTTSLPRGVGTQSVTNLSQAQGDGPEPHVSQSNGSQRLSRSHRYFLQHSKSSASILGSSGTGNGSDAGSSGNPSYLHGPHTGDRMSNYYTDTSRGQPNNGMLSTNFKHTIITEGVTMELMLPTQFKPSIDALGVALFQCLQMLVIILSCPPLIVA